MKNAAIAAIVLIAGISWAQEKQINPKHLLGNQAAILFRTRNQTTITTSGSLTTIITDGPPDKVAFVYYTNTTVIASCPAGDGCDVVVIPPTDIPCSQPAGTTCIYALTLYAQMQPAIGIEAVQFTVDGLPLDDFNSPPVGEPFWYSYSNTPMPFTAAQVSTVTNTTENQTHTIGVNFGCLNMDQCSLEDQQTVLKVEVYH